MPLQLTNHIFFIDRVFFKHLSFFSEFSIFHRSENLEKIFRVITKFVYFFKQKEISYF